MLLEGIPFDVRSGELNPHVGKSIGEWK